MQQRMEALDGVLLIDKGQEMTSHDVVAVARKQLGTGRGKNRTKVGHCGTLDPIATGLLVLLVGKATKIQDLLMAEEKEYVGTLRLGVTTHSQDRQGDVLEEKEVPELSDDEVRSVFAKFDGEIAQLPPMVSAKKVDGVRLYKQARKGVEVEREPRMVRVMEHEITEIAVPEVSFRIVCSKGFYVRTYAHDIGQEIGCGAHLRELRRTKSGKFSVEGAMTFEELKVASREEIAARMMSLPEVSRMRGV